MIIGISGKINSGKDTVGNIIQYLVCLSKGTFESGWQIKKFADKLKDIICLLIGCTREQLENQEFKNKELGEEWWYWQLERDGGYSTILLPYYESTGTENFKLVKLTPRLLLQLLGAECGRNIIHPNIWVNSLMSEYKPSILENLHVPGDYVGRCFTCDEPFMGAKRSCTCKNCESSIEKYPNWIITDTRFPNELQAVKNRDGLTIKVIRTQACESIGMQIVNMSDGKIVASYRKEEHESETALDQADFDYTIYNTGTIEDLIEKVKEILFKEKII